MNKIFLFLLLNSLIVPAFADDHVMKNADQLSWQEGPPFLPSGAKMVVLTGDPGKAGPFTLRLQFPSNYKIPAHWHSQIENITVIDGELNMGMGDKLDEKKSQAIPKGGFVMMPMKSHHFAYTKGTPTTVQLHGQGPFDITYINKADDPRTKK